MEKIINIDGKDVKCKCVAVTSIIYKEQFGEEWFPEVENLKDLVVEVKAKGKTEQTVDFTKIKPTTIMKLTYAMAKTADRSIADFDEWLGQFETFPIFDIIGKLYPLMIKSLGVDTKNA